MKGNNLKSPLLMNEMFNDFQFTLLKLDLSGDKNAPTNLQELRRYVNYKLIFCVLRIIRHHSNYNQTSIVIFQSTVALI